MQKKPIVTLVCFPMFVTCVRNAPGALLEFGAFQSVALPFQKVKNSILSGKMG